MIIEQINSLINPSVNCCHCSSKLIQKYEFDVICDLDDDCVTDNLKLTNY